jgi:hypothetical protein
MKIDADAKELLESIERGEWKSADGGKRERNSLRSLRQGDIPQRSEAEHPAVEQGPGGDSQAGARRGVAVSDVDREPAAQVRDRAPYMAVRYRAQRGSMVALHPWMRDFVPYAVRLALERL